jgi:hypothetical protein
MTYLLVALIATAAAGQERPHAYVLDHADQWTETTSAAQLLEQAGFHVEPLPLDRSPFELLDSDLILLASFSSEHPQYRQYMQQYAADLYNFVDKGNVLLQMTQADQVEAVPPFLPTTHGARRSDRDFPTAQILSPEHPLLEGIADNGEEAIQIDRTSTVWESFVDQSGFEVILAGDEHAEFPALMEGAYGQGRVILAAMHIDKNAPRDKAADDPFGEAREGFNRAFFANLARHVIAVRDRRTQPLQITPSPRQATEFVSGSWTLAVLPDTQVYSLRYPGLFLTQTAWILQNQDRLNIQFVVHLGDIVNNNSTGEWHNARQAMRLLDGRVPYAVVPGNHDYGPSGDASTRDTLLNDYFPFDTISTWPTFGGARESGKLDNTFDLFEAGGRKWIVLALEWAPRDETVAWANQVMTEHADRTGILITHAYMNNNDRRYDHTDAEHPQHYNPHEYRTPGSKNDGQQLWDKLVRRHSFALTLNGHVLGDGTGYLASENDHGQTCHQILANYQMRQLGGEAYLRLLEFQPDGATVRVKTYSPLYDRYLLDEDQHFRFQLD